MRSLRKYTLSMSTAWTFASKIVQMLPLKSDFSLYAEGKNLAFAALVVIIAAVITLGLTHHDWLAGTFGGVFILDQ